MKIFVIVFVIFAVIASVLGLKNPICGLEHSKNDDDGKMCAANFPSWTYDKDANECIFFTYGGCFGNANRFNSHYECTHVCKEKRINEVRIDNEKIDDENIDDEMNDDEYSDYDSFDCECIDDEEPGYEEIENDNRLLLNSWYESLFKEKL